MAFAYSDVSPKNHLNFCDTKFRITRKTRDSEVTLKEGVIVISGGFPSRGGSVKNPRLSAYKDTVIRVEIPETLYAKIAECQGVSLVQEDTDLEADLIKIEEEIQKLESKKNGNS